MSPSARTPAPSPAAAAQRRGEPSDGAGGEPAEPRSLYDVPGWFYPPDVVLFDWLLDRQLRLGQRGDLLEMGAYLGKSAVLMRAYLRSDETFTVCDLFDSQAPTERNGREVRGSYATLTRRGFETNYLAFHEELPRLLQAPTSVVPEEVADDSCRFVHVDASHMYEHVYQDIQAARTALGGDGGVVVLDDYRSSHTPGVACATWQAVLEGGLRPICVSPHKFYGTWSDPRPTQDALAAELESRGDCWLQWQEVAGQPLLLVGAQKATPPKLPEPRRHGDADAEGGSAGPGRKGAAATVAPARTRLRHLATDLSPPLLTRAVRGRRARRRD